MSLPVRLFRPMPLSRTAWALAFRSVEAAVAGAAAGAAVCALAGTAQVVKAAKRNAAEKKENDFANIICMAPVDQSGYNSEGCSGPANFPGVQAARAFERHSTQSHPRQVHGSIVDAQRLASHAQLNSTPSPRIFAGAIANPANLG